MYEYTINTFLRVNHENVTQFSDLPPSVSFSKTTTFKTLTFCTSICILNDQSRTLPDWEKRCISIPEWLKFLCN